MRNRMCVQSHPFGQISLPAHYWSRFNYEQLRPTGKDVSMGILLLGHGALVVDPAVTSLEICAIPQGTTLQFYSDIGQTLSLTRAVLADIWPLLTAPWPALDATNVTYNLSLAHDDVWVKLCEDGIVDVANFNGHQLIVPGYNYADPVQLCTGTALRLGPEGEVISGTCPTDPQQVAVGWTHDCDGLLRHYGGTELFWVSCTSVLFIEDDTEEEAALNAAISKINAVVELGSDPDQEKLTGTVSLVIPRDDFIWGEITDADGKEYAFKLPASSGVVQGDSVRFDGARSGKAAFDVVKA